jgi:hypothetical protein
VGGVPADYDTVSGTVNFAPGETAKTIIVTTHGDTSVEGDEGFVLATENTSTSSLKNASFGNNRNFFTRSEGRLNNDDGPVVPYYVLVGKTANQPTATGQVSFLRRFTTDGLPIDNWASGMPNLFGAVSGGLCRAQNGDILSTRFGVSEGPARLSAAGALLDAGFGGLIGLDESCEYDAQGRVWVGEAVPGSETEALLRQFSADGLRLQSLIVPVGERGIDWIALGNDACTLYYTSEDGDVRRFDVCSAQILPHFATGLAEPCYALRRRTNDELLIACKTRVYRYAGSGALLAEYSQQDLGENDVDGLFALQLDPDGETFWTGGATSGRVIRARIDNGNVVTSFLTGIGGVGGLLIVESSATPATDILFVDGFDPQP